MPSDSSEQSKPSLLLPLISFLLWWVTLQPLQTRSASTYNDSQLLPRGTCTSWSSCEAAPTQMALIPALGWVTFLLSNIRSLPSAPPYGDVMLCLRAEQALMPLLFCCNPGRTISQQGVRILMPRFRQPPLGLWVEDEMLEYDQAVVQDAQQTQAELHGVTYEP